MRTRVHTVFSVLLTAASLLQTPRAQSVGGFTNPFYGVQPWTSEPVSVYAGLARSYTVTKFSSVRLTGLTLNEHAASAMGIYLPVDKDGDGVVDLLDGRPIYLQRDARTVQPALVEVETGIAVGRYYLYYLYSLGGWAVHPTVGSEQAMLFCPSDAAMAHEIHGQRSWERTEGTSLQPDRRLQLLDLSQENADALTGTGNFAPVDARLGMLVASNTAASAAQGNLAPMGDLCPQGMRYSIFRAKLYSIPVLLLGHLFLTGQTYPHFLFHIFREFQRRAHEQVPRLPPWPLWGLELPLLRRAVCRMPSRWVKNLSSLRVDSRRLPLVQTRLFNVYTHSNPCSTYLFFSPPPVRSGKYRDAVGGRTVLDCTNCTSGRYASQGGAEACGGQCPLGKHSSVSGASDKSSCSKCPPR